jgi:hypothetical protein
MRCMKIVVSLAVICLTGCTAVVRPTISRSEFLVDEAKIPASVAFHATNKFKNFSGEHFDWWCDGTKYKMEFGSVTIDWFNYALESKFTNVSLAYGAPKFPYKKSDVDFVLTPEFTSFKAGGPVVVKLEKYWVELGMNVTIQDRNGKILETLQLKEKGSRAGTIGVNPGVHLYPEICRLAIKPLVNKTIEKLVELNDKK